VVRYAEWFGPGPATAFCPVDKTIFRHGNGAIQLKFLPLSWHEEWGDRRGGGKK